MAPALCATSGRAERSSGACTSWGSACTLWYALSTVAITGSGDEIWVAAGTYRPTIGVTRTATFQLKSGVALYGGFTGTETRRDQRNWTANVTVLSGDIGVPGASGDNAYHVLRSIGVDNSAVVDGFTVRDGNADGDFTVYQDIGGGLCNCGDGPYPNNDARRQPDGAQHDLLQQFRGVFGRGHV